MTRSRQVPSHEHKSFDIQPLGHCRACDDFHERQGVTREQCEAVIFAEPRIKGVGPLRVLRMLDDVDHERHDQIVGWLAEGLALADAVDAIFGEGEEPATSGDES